MKINCGGGYEIFADSSWIRVRISAQLQFNLYTTLHWVFSSLIICVNKHKPMHFLSLSIWLKKCQINTLNCIVSGKIVPVNGPFCVVKTHLSGSIEHIMSNVLHWTINLHVLFRRNCMNGMWKLSVTMTYTLIRRFNTNSVKWQSVSVSRYL